MKKILLLLVFCCLSVFTDILFAQTPDMFKYQAVVRDANGALLKNQEVTLLIWINDDKTPKNTYFQEEHTVTTNDFGMVSLNIGGGTPVISKLGNIDWSVNNYYLFIQLKDKNSGGYTDLGSSRLLSVPYALYAKQSGSGVAGPTGPQGEKGEKGDKGEQGLQGVQGIQGPQGEKGDKGDIGDVGEQGIQGPKGDKGDDGAKGEQGIQGPQGVKGDTGPQGAKGDKGDPGIDGAKGDKGDPGIDGAKGDKGDKGDPGIDGAKGDTGPQGDKGEIGAKGDKGEKGDTGPQGDKGEIGVKGDKGEKGDTGPQGDKGEIGIKGDKGEKGDTGPQGDKGDKGDPGIDGPKGDKGEKGDTGDTGPTGPIGGSDTEVMFNDNGVAAGSSNLSFAKGDGLLGVGLYNAQARIHARNYSVLFDGSWGNTPVSGAGKRFMWITGKTALRAGEVEGGQWNDESIGTNSIALGFNPVALGKNSIAIGNRLNSNADYSFSFGNGLMNNSFGSVVLGMNNDSWGDMTKWVDTDPLFIVGNGKDDANVSNALVILKNGNIGIGTNNPSDKLEINGQIKITGGFPGAGKVLTSNADGLALWQFPNVTTPAGNTGNIQFNSGGSFAADDLFFWDATNKRLGVNVGNPANTLDVNGNTKIIGGSVLFEGTTGSVPASGVGTRFMWVPQKAALRAGKITDKADYWDNANIGKYSVAFNEDTKASGESSVAFNAQTVAAGSYSFAAGAGTETSASASFVVGAYNEIISGSPTAWVETDPLFVIGNGKGSRKNAVTVLKNGNIGIGFSSPSNLLEINGKIRIAGGSPVANKVLTATDANGNAIWSSISASGTDGYIQFSKAGALASNSKLFWDDAAGKVTVGGTPTDESSIVELNSTTKGFLPPRMTRIQMYNINNPTAGLVVYNTTDKTLAFFDGSEWMSCAGKSLLYKFTVGSTTFTVFPYDSGTYTWSLAQSYCNSLNQFGYDDWYLPSRSELHYLYDNKSNIDGILNKLYWSSTESSDMFKQNAYCIDFNTGSEYTFPKTNKYNVRCIRKD